jgi:hypothetical protein
MDFLFKIIIIPLASCLVVCTCKPNTGRLQQENGKFEAKLKKKGFIVFIKMMPIYWENPNYKEIKSKG